GGHPARSEVGTMTSGQKLLDEWNSTTLALVQALLGAVSPNFRMVALFADGDVWRLQFTLETDNALDREEIDDIASEFEAQHSSNVEYEVETKVTTGHIAWPAFPARVVFRRKES